MMTTISVMFRCTRPWRRFIVQSLAVLATLLAVLGSSRPSGAAADATVVSTTVLPATTLDESGCNNIDFGSVTTGVAVLSYQCSVIFGSSNDTAMLRVFQRDRIGRAMTRFGAAWNVHSTVGHYRGAGMFSTARAWVVGDPPRYGDPAQILTSTDGGTTWSNQSACAGAKTLNRVHAFSDTVAVAMGSTPCRTTNGGAGWSPVVNPGAPNWSNISGATDGSGWAYATAGGSAVWRSSDSGATWSRVDITGAVNVSGIVGVSSTEALVVDINGHDPLLWRTTNSGASWTSQPIATGLSKELSAIDRSNSGTLIAAGTDGMRRSTDGGATWTVTYASPRLAVRSLGGNRWLSSYFNNTLTVSVDDGITWTPVSSGTSSAYHVYSIPSMVGSTLIVPARGEGIFLSTDSGSSFAPVAPLRPIFNSVASLGNDAFVIVGDGGEVRYSTNGGTTIMTGASGTPNNLVRVVEIGANSALAIGNAGTLVKTTDGGAIWSPITSPTSSSFRDLDIASKSGAIYFTTSTGELFVSYDAGASFRAITTGTSDDLLAVAVDSTGTNIWVSTSTNGEIRHSADGGDSWQVRNTGYITPVNSMDVSKGILIASHVLYSVDAINSTEIRRSVNGGVSWTTSGSYTNHIHQVQFAGGQRVVAAREAGGVTLSEDLGVSFDNTAAGVFVDVNSVRALSVSDANTFVAVGGGQLIATNAPDASVPDFGESGADFGSPNGAFGACLETSTNTLSTIWSPAGSCVLGTNAHWNAVPAATSGAEIATSAMTVETAQVTLRFGFRPANSQPSGKYRANVTFEVIAPSI